MITDKEAIEKAAEYLNSLSSELSGGLLDHPERVRLESIKQNNGEWHIVLSYFTKATKRKPEWVNVLEGVRRFKEFTVNAKGQIVAMQDPTLVS
jgi:hypothetical protein